MPKSVLTLATVSACVLGVACCSSAHSTADSQRLPPRDEAARAPEFTSFLEAFRDALERRDADFIVSVAADTTAFSFGAEAGGRAAFRNHYRLDDPNAEFWTTAAELLQYGGVVDGDCSADSKCEVTYPYWWVEFIRDPELGEAIIKRARVPLLTEPDENAKVAATLSYHDVKTADRAPADACGNILDEWAYIELPDGRSGWVKHGERYHTTDYRMGFRREGGRWVLGYFIAGD